MVPVLEMKQITKRFRDIFYAAHRHTCQIHLHECFFYAGFPPTITLNNRCFKGNSLEPRHMELNLSGGCHEIAIVMTARDNPCRCSLRS